MTVNHLNCTFPGLVITVYFRVIVNMCLQSLLVVFYFLAKRTLPFCSNNDCIKKIPVHVFRGSPK